MSLRNAHQIKSRKTALWIRDDALQEIAKVAEYPPDGRALKQIGAVLTLKEERTSLFVDVEKEVQLRRPRFDWDQIRGQPLEDRRLLIGTLKGQRRMKQRVAAEVALGPQFLYQLLERKVLIGVGADSDLPHPLQQLAKRGVSGEIASQNQGVDEETDETFDLRPIAVGDGRSDDDVFLARMAG